MAEPEEQIWKGTVMLEKPDTYLCHCINPWFTHTSILVCSSGLLSPSLTEGLSRVTEQSDHRPRKSQMQQVVEDSLKLVLPTNLPCSYLSLGIHFNLQGIKEVEVDLFWSQNQPLLLSHSLHPSNHWKQWTVTATEVPQGHTVYNSSANRNISSSQLSCSLSDLQPFCCSCKHRYHIS